MGKLPGRKRGRPPFTPTKDQKALVYELAAAGLSQDYIRTRILNPQTQKPLSKEALEKHFREELDRGMPEADADAVKMLCHHMRGRPAVIKRRKVVQSEIKPNLTAAIYWTKARLGWRDGGERGGEGGDQKIIIEGGLDEATAKEPLLPSPLDPPKPAK